MFFRRVEEEGHDGLGREGFLHAVGAFDLDDARTGGGDGLVEEIAVAFLHDDLSPGPGRFGIFLIFSLSVPVIQAAVLSRIAQAAPEVTMAPSTFRSSAIFAPTLSCSSNILAKS